MILVLHMNALGEAVFSLPLLHALKHGSPPWRVVTVGRGGSGELIRASGLADQALFRIPALGLRCHAQLIRAVRAAHPAACLALSTSRSSSLLAWLSGAPRRVGYREADFSFLLNTHLPLEGSGIQKYLSFLPPLGIKPTVTSYCGLVSAAPEAQTRAAQLLAQAGIAPGAPFVALSPISTGKVGLKAYPVEQWAAACRRLSERGWPLVLVGSGGNAAAHRRMLEGINGKALSLAGQTSAPVLAAVLQRAACAVGVDTGPIHVAAAVGTRCVVLFGATDPRRTAPCGEGHMILSRGLACQPCLDAPCRNNGACMRQIAPQEIADAVEAVLANAQPSRGLTSLPG